MVKIGQGSYQCFLMKRLSSTYVIPDIFHRESILLFSDGFWLTTCRNDEEHRFSLGLLKILLHWPINAHNKMGIISGRECSKKHGLSIVEGKAAVLLTRGAYTMYVSTAKGRECRWRLFSTFPVFDTISTPI